MDLVVEDRSQVMTLLMPPVAATHAMEVVADEELPTVAAAKDADMEIEVISRPTNVNEMKHI